MEQRRLSNPKSGGKKSDLYRKYVYKCNTVKEEGKEVMISVMCSQTLASWSRVRDHFGLREILRKAT